MYHYVQPTGEETWQAVPQTKLQEYIGQHKPMFATILAVSSLVEDGQSKEETDKLTYLGPMYFDWDGTDIDDVLPNVLRFLKKLEEKNVDMDSIKLYATGGKGFHCEIPMEVFTEKQPKAGWAMLPIIYKEVALSLAVDTLDLRVYSTRRGRQWRQPNVLRPNGRYKVPVTYAQLKDLDAESYAELTSAPRPPVLVKAPVYALGLAMLFDTMSQKVTKMVANRKKAKVSKVAFRADMPSLKALCEGKGIKDDIGFNTIAMQIAILSDHFRWSEETMIKECEGLISSHQSDGTRYNTEAKRRNDLIRMFRYMQDNPCYEATVGAVKSLLIHSAPDLDGITVAREDVDKAIEEAEANPKSSEEGPGEYDSLTGVTINRFGVYAQTEDGQRRICALSFDKVNVLKSLENGTISALEADVLVNGRFITRQGLELDTFGSVQAFNKLCVRFGHAFQGSDANLRGLYMKTIETAKKSGGETYVTSREGLDIINIPHHENPAVREPFMIWADGRGVVVEPRVAEAGVDICFQGYPDPKGQYKVDLGDAPRLSEWLKEEDNKDRLENVIDGMLHCQKPEVIAKIMGWNTACFFRMMFHKAYGKFPLLHINAPAGTGKSDMIKAGLGLFYHSQQPLTLSPSSTVFALSYAAGSSVTAPLVIDEYKPHAMADHMKERLKAMFRDAYNCREQQRGGGSRDNDDYRSMHKTQLCAPIAFIAEAMEEESAVMERVVLVTIVKPHPVENNRNFLNFMKWQNGANLLAMLGNYIASSTVKKYSLEKFVADFDEVYMEARKAYMITGDEPEDSLTAEQIKEKSNIKERTVFNHSVAAYGLRRFSNLIEGIFPGRFSEKLEELKAHVFDRMSDVTATTQPEWLKVMNTFADMMTFEEGLRLEKGKDWHIIKDGGREVLELNLRVCYNKYRAYCRQAGVKPLYPSDGSFMHGMNDCQAKIGNIRAGTLRVPGGAQFFSLKDLESCGFRMAIGG